VCDNEAESSFITSPTRSSVSTIGSSRQRRREMTVTESPSVGHSAKRETVEDILSLTDRSSTPVSSLSRKNKVDDRGYILFLLVVTECLEAIWLPVVPFSSHDVRKFNYLLT
jgi:hypothetical protein